MARAYKGLHIFVFLTSFIATVCLLFTMERLFSPCTRYHDLVERQGGRVSRESRLRELNLDVSADEFLSAERGFTYADLYAMLGNGKKIAWLTPHAFVLRASYMYFQGQMFYQGCTLEFKADGEEIFALARSPEHLLEICNVVLRLLAVSVVHSVTLRKVGTRPGALINAPALAYLMEQCQSVKVLKFEQTALDEDHCFVLGAYSKPDLEIELTQCKLTSAGTIALAEVLGRNQGPTKIDGCDNIDTFVLANGLRGNSRLKSLRPRISNILEVRNRQVLAIADALKENKGLAFLNLSHDSSMSDEGWDAVCDSLKTHPTLQVLNLDSDAFEDPAVLKSRIQALLEMVKMNLSLHTIYLHEHLSRHELFRGSVLPYLETNRLRPRLLAIQKTRPITYRAKVLGRALLAVRTDPNRFWMLLLGNAEVAFPPKNATNLPTPATTAATSTTTNVAGVAASAMCALPSTATGSLPTAAAAGPASATTPSTASASIPTAAAALTVATPSAGQKRKARP
jgi:hypothetical protein